MSKWIMTSYRYKLCLETGKQLNSIIYIYNYGFVLILKRTHFINKCFFSAQKNFRGEFAYLFMTGYINSRKPQCIQNTALLEYMCTSYCSLVKPYKGQIISKCPFCAFKSPQKTQQISALTSKKRSDQKRSVRESK